MKKWSIIFLSIALISIQCAPVNKKKMIIGTWELIYPKGIAQFDSLSYSLGKPLSQTFITFKKDQTVLNEFKRGNSVIDADTATYEIIDDGKTLIIHTKENKSLNKILKLTGTSLILIELSKADTFSLKKIK